MYCGIAGSGYTSWGSGLAPIVTSESLIHAPVGEPVALTTVKLQRRVSTASLDFLFALWIAAARQHFEEQTGRQCITATWEYWLAGFPGMGVIELPHPPLQTVTSVVYDDSNGDEQTVDAATYTVEAPQGTYAKRGRIVLNTGASWPTPIDDGRFSVRVRYVAGYGNAAKDMPPIVQAALLFLVGHFHKYQEEAQEPRSGSLQTIPIGATKMIEAFKYSALPIHPPMRAL